MMGSGAFILLNSRESLKNKARASCRGARGGGPEICIVLAE